MVKTPLSLSIGSKGRIVSELQAAIGAKVDGSYGPITHRMACEHLGRQVKALTLQDLWSLGVQIQLGIDLSGHNEGGNKGLVDFKKVREAGVSFTYLKATEGRSYTNVEAQRQVEAARSAGLMVGMYHFGDPSADRTNETLSNLFADAREEANHFLDVQKRFCGVPDLIPMLDVEAGYLSKLEKLWAMSNLGKSSKARADTTALWVLEVLRELRQPGVYTARWAVNSFLSNADPSVLIQIAACPLWLASYNSGAAPARSLDSPWRPYSIWQLSGSGSIPGVDGKVDLNIALTSDLTKLKVRT